MIRRTRNVALMAGLAGYTIFRARRRALRPVLDLPPVRYNVGVRRNIRVSMPDGVTLATDHHFPRARGSFPTILIRTPYGRGISGSVSGLSEGFRAQRFAERGYHVVVQDVRGRFDSQGEFEPFVNEREDGLATLEWIRQQRWFNGVIGLWGQSYLGYTQWAVATTTPANVKAMMPGITGSQMKSVVFPDGAYALNTNLRWAYLTEFVGNRRGWYNWRSVTYSRRLLRGRIFERAYNHLPLQEADQKVGGRSMPPYQYTFDEAAQPRWEDIDFSHEVARVEIPVHLVGGWYDAMLRELLTDYETLHAAGHTPYLTIGPWSHIDQRVNGSMLRQGIRWFDAHLKGDTTQLRGYPVHVRVMGTEKWRNFDSWPPPSQAQRLYLQAAGGLSFAPPQVERAYTHYHYDPANPTPSIGGTNIFPPAGPADQRKLELRDDVLLFTTEPVQKALEIIGPVRLELYVRSNRDYTDFLGRLCVVSPEGISTNICEGLLRVDPTRGEVQPDGSLKLVVDLWATAYSFQPGYCIRLHVASAGHPRWSRNLNTGEGLGSGKRMLVAAQTIFHDREHPSALVLPVITG